MSDQTTQISDFSIYIHIPFCVQKCAYCDFASCVATQTQIDDYLNALSQEIKMQMVENHPERLFGHCAPKTIFIGGGTPSILSVVQFDKLMNGLSVHFDLSHLSEFTVEVNPGTLSDDLAQCYKRNGVTRISMGAQSFQEHQLEQLGRIHRAEDVHKSVRVLRKNGIKRISIDLMIGLPDQTMEDLNHDLDQALALNVDHISVYSLIIEAGTRLNELYDAGMLHMPNEALERDMYWQVVRRLEVAGYNQYEISNFAKPNEESLHNLVYWNCDCYYGFGVASHSRLPHVRKGNESELSDYMEHVRQGKLPVEEVVKIGDEEWLEEWVMLGLRLIKGICPQELSTSRRRLFESRYRLRFEKTVEEGFLKWDGDRYTPTNKGLDLNNQMLVSLLF